MRTIHKYELFNTDNYMSTYADSKILSVAEQGGIPCIWLEVDTFKLPSQRRFKIYPTGGYILEGEVLTHVGTIHIPQHGTVLHVYEVEL